MITLKKEHKIELADTLGGHWYRVICVDHKCKANGKFYPSSTTILNAYPQSEHLTRWIAEQGWNESQRIKIAAGERGTMVHTAINALLAGVTLNRKEYIPPVDGASGSFRAPTTEEWWKISTYVAWHKEFKPELIVSEFPVLSVKHGYTGTLDRIYRIGGKIIVTDDKTSGSIHAHFALQVASYACAVEEMSTLKVDETAILQLGAKNKNGYRWVLYPDWRKHIDVFLSVKNTWMFDNDVDKDFAPPVLKLPEKLTL